MKIAHINNISGVASLISKYQKTHGKESDVYVFNKLILNQFGGVFINYKSPLSRWKLFRKIKNEYDVLHYHYPYGSLKKSMEKLKQGKVYIKHYHGDDLRQKYDDDFCLVSTPDLLEYAPNGKWLPNPIDMNEVKQIIHNKVNHKNKKKIRLAYYPYYKSYPSSLYDDNSHIFNKLVKINLYDVIEIIKMSHLQALESLYSCDIVIGKILPDIGWFGKFELEGMALGKPVMTYVSDELFDKYRPPIYRTTKDSFFEDLKNLISDESIQNKLTEEGVDYVNKNHSIENIMVSLDKYYNI